MGYDSGWSREWKSPQVCECWNLSGHRFLLFNQIVVMENNYPMMMIFFGVSIWILTCLWNTRTMMNQHWSVTRIGKSHEYWSPLTMYQNLSFAANHHLSWSWLQLPKLSPSFAIGVGLSVARRALKKACAREHRAWKKRRWTAALAAIEIELLWTHGRAIMILLDFLALRIHPLKKSWQIVSLDSRHTVFNRKGAATFACPQDLPRTCRNRPWLPQKRKMRQQHGKCGFKQISSDCVTLAKQFAFTRTYSLPNSLMKFRSATTRETGKQNLLACPGHSGATLGSGRGKWSRGKRHIFLWTFHGKVVAFV